MKDRKLFSFPYKCCDELEIDFWSNCSNINNYVFRRDWNYMWVDMNQSWCLYAIRYMSEVTNNIYFPRAWHLQSENIMRHVSFSLKHISKYVKDLTKWIDSLLSTRWMNIVGSSVFTRDHIPGPLLVGPWISLIFYNYTKYNCKVHVILTHPGLESEIYFTRQPVNRRHNREIRDIRDPARQYSCPAFRIGQSSASLPGSRQPDGCSSGMTVLGSSRPDRDISRSKPVNTFPIAYDTSPGTIIFEDVIWNRAFRPGNPIAVDTTPGMMICTLVVPNVISSSAFTSIFRTCFQITVGIRIA